MGTYKPNKMKHGHIYKTILNICCSNQKIRKRTKKQHKTQRKKTKGKHIFNNKIKKKDELRQT